MGRTSRFNGLTIRPRVSNVTAPKRGLSSGWPRMTGDVAVVPAIVKRHSETPRSIVVPSARVNSALRVDRKRNSFQSPSGSTV